MGFWQSSPWVCFEMIHPSREFIISCLWPSPCAKKDSSPSRPSLLLLCLSTAPGAGCPLGLLQLLGGGISAELLPEASLRQAGVRAGILSKKLV